MTDIGACSQWQKVHSFPISRRKFSVQRPLCDILTALWDTKLYFCIPNVEMCLLANQIFDVLFYLIILNGVSFSQFCIKQRKKIPILGVGSGSQNG